MVKKVKILLIDDSEVVARHITGLLLKENWGVQTASTVPAAIELFKRFTPDALLVDFVLEGGQTGLQLLSSLFSLSEKRHPAAILVLGPVSPEDEKKVISLGARTIQKPVRGKEQDFLQNVAFWLKDSKLIG